MTSLHDFDNSGHVRRFLRGAAGRTGRHSLVVALCLIVAIPVVAAAQQPPRLQPGDIVAMVGPDGGFLGPGNPVKIDPVTGERTVLSDFGDPSQGPYISNPSILMNSSAALAIEDATAVFVIYPTMGLVRVDAATGVRTIVSDVAGVYSTLAIESSGDFLVANPNALIRVSRSTGIRTTVSDFRDATLGPAPGPLTLAAKLELAVEASGQILVSANGTIIRVDPFNGRRTLLTDFGDPPHDPPVVVRDVAVDVSGDILVAGFTPPDFTPDHSLVHFLFRVDPVTGARTLEIETLRVGGIFPGAVGAPLELAVEETGDILEIIGDLDTVHGLRRLGSLTGAPALRSPPLGSPSWHTDVAVVPTPLVNQLVSLSVTNTVLEPAVSDPSAASGVFRITATLTNISSAPIRNPFVRVAELSASNRLVTADRPLDLIREGGKGTRQTPDVGTDGVLSPGESVTVELGVGLQTRQRFNFFVNVFGEPR